MYPRYYPQEVRSTDSRKARYLRFINRTTRRVTVIWIDYVGFPITYGVLEPYQHFDIHTYETHPWMCEDDSTKTQLLLNQSLLYYPHEDPNSPKHIPELKHPVDHLHPELVNESDRQIVNITIPVLSLFNRSMETVLMNVKSHRDIEAFDIPLTLKRQLKSHFINPDFPVLSAFEEEYYE